MNSTKVHEALRLIEQMIDFGDYPIGLHQVQRLLHDAITDKPDDDEMVELTAEPPCNDHDIDGRLRSIFLTRKTKN